MDGIVRSMRKRLREPTNAINEIPTPTNVTDPPGERPGKHSLKGIPSANCVTGWEDLHQRRLPITSRPPDMVVLMMRRTSWRYVTGATRPSTGARETDGTLKGNY